MIKSIILFSCVSIISIFMFSCQEIYEIDAIEGNWKVTSMKDVAEFEEGPSFLINLKTMKIAGFSGCNRFFGTVKLDKKNKLTFENMGGTRKMCGNFEVENMFITLISKVDAFKFNKSKLQFLSKSGDVLMTMKATEIE
ncbi:META domain-containing protein [Flavobacteriaceae bacterium]|nr:META domain-containing protein [Bacteroidota bacterium]MDA9551873.1 META domain-containing protein [Flavobacteriaceae bacterium]MDC0956251.1 META domain-containing protein [Flavobacteriaceae bacterium]MDG1379855.1 META domain-containing protein [Flavobacteriaceae bacterium]MDG2350941.1 META domain-containing protein [Flavobacteriaceae bacterium]